MRAQQGNRFFFNVDWITILIYIALCVIGFINIFASIPNPENSTVFNFGSSYGRQLIFIMTGLLLGFTILLLDAQFFSVFSPIIYGATIFLLFMVLVIGNKVAGNQGRFNTHTVADTYGESWRLYVAVASRHERSDHPSRPISRTRYSAEDHPRLPPSKTWVAPGIRLTLAPHQRAS